MIIGLIATKSLYYATQLIISLLHPPVFDYFIQQVNISDVLIPFHRYLAGVVKFRYGTVYLPIEAFNISVLMDPECVPL